VSLLRLQDVPPRPSRLALSMTYAEAFGSASTAEVCDVMRELLWKPNTESRVRAYSEWAVAIHYNAIPVPEHSWPSPAHEQAIFEESIREMRSWGASWPEIDHERTCYNFMCDHVCIHPDVAREKGLGLVVKISDPPCIGFVNCAVYDKTEATEQYQHRHGGVPAPELWRREDGIDPEDWLTLTITPNRPTVDFHQTLEVAKYNTTCGWPGHVTKDLGPRYKGSVPGYMVRGVWYDCPRDDACVGAELTNDSPEDYDALLV
jgi:hypothetical protein